MDSSNIINSGNRAAAATGQEKADGLYKKIAWRILPIIFIAYLFAILDRINIGYAQLQMKQELGFSDAVYGFGAGVFFLSYLLLEVPSNIAFERIGARRTFLRIMVLWGLTSGATMFVTTPTQFYVVRFFLGAFEAGFFPGIILYLTYWFPSARRGRVTGQFLFALPIAGVFGGPVSGWLMSSMNGVAGLGGWQWCLLMEGLPSVFIGIACYFFLSDKPADAKWLGDDEKRIVEAALAADKGPNGGHGRMRDVFTDPKVYFLGLIYFSCACGGYTFNFWLPTMIKNLGVADIGRIGWYSMVPYLSGALGMLFLGWNSDRLRERRWHIAAANVAGALLLCATTFINGGLLLPLALLSAAMFFVLGAGAVFWAVPPTYLSGKALAPGIAFISSLGIIGGFVSPALIGLIKTHTGNLNFGLYLMCGILLVGAATSVFFLDARHTRAGGKQGG